MNRSLLIASTVAALSAPLIAATPAQAQSGLQLLEQVWDPTTRDLKSVPSYRHPEFFREIGKNSWNIARPILEKQLREQLGALRWQGQNAYDIELSLATSPAVRVSSEGAGNIRLSVSLPNNAMTFKTTQPTPLGKYADPKFGLTCDIELEIVLEIPSDMRGITVAKDSEGKDWAKLRVLNTNMTSQNLISDAPKALFDFANGISKFFGGPDFWAILMNKLNQERSIAPYVHASLGPVNTAIAQLAAKGYTVLNVARTLMASESPRPTQVAALGGGGLARQSTSSLSLMAYRTDYNVPIAGSGVLRGVIRWDKSLGVPTVRRGFQGRLTSPFVFQAEVQNGPGQQGRFGFPLKTVRRQATGKLVEVGNTYEFHYEVLGLPNEVPMELVTMGLASDVDWAAINPQPLPPKVASFQPSGWRGSIRILKPVPGVRNHSLDGRFQMLGQSQPDETLLLPARFSCAQQSRPVIRRIQRTFVRNNPMAAGMLDGVDFTLTVIAPTVLR